MLCDGKDCKLISLGDVRYFESCGSYSKTWFNGGHQLIYRSLNHLDSRLSGRHFFRANRQFIINISHIREVGQNRSSGFKIVMTCGKMIDISRRRAQLFRETLSL
ncbi:MAG: LytTR family transcriptional regulator [Rhodothermaceae bacterium]|nr:LytTR family transcriptional regulator [Rhodothermaceae bacterium]